MRTGARRYWLEIPTGDLNGERVEGPDFGNVRAARNYLRNLCAQIDARELRRASWADTLYFQIVLEGKRKWYGVWDDEHRVLIPKV